MQRRYILLVDNDRDFLDTRAEYLETSDYVVLKAYTLPEARQIMAEARIHVAVLDIRLVDDDDERDTSGLTLAKESSFQSIPKIILTGFPSYEYVREVLGPVLNGLPAAVQFLAKHEGPEAMLVAVAEVLERYSGINRDLTIHWSAQLSFMSLVSLIEPNLKPETLLDRAGELNDLFRRLFFDCHQITVGWLLAQNEQKVRVAVFGFLAGGSPRQFVVVCGRKEKIEAEQARYEKFAAKLGGEAGPVQPRAVETVQLSAVAYGLAGSDLEETVSLADFYRNSPVEMAVGMVKQLFEITMQPWYSRGRFRQEAGSFNQFFLKWLHLPEILPDTLNLKLERLCQQALTAGLVEIHYSPYQLLFSPVGAEALAYPNPLSHFPQLLGLETAVLWGTTYGQLNGQAVLVDRQGQSRLIDFSQADQGPLVRDFASMESVIKFELLATSDIQMRHRLETQLLMSAQGVETVERQPLEAETEKATQAIMALRQQAWQVVGYEAQAYWLALYFYAVAHLRVYEADIQYTRPQLSRYLHSLLSAAMICQKLLPQVERTLPAQALYRLWVNEAEQEVWVEGKKVELAPTEYELLLVLYRRPNQLCSRQEISQELYRLDYGLETEDAINTTMTRLRRKVEAVSTPGKYILTVRGKGYRLKLD